MKILHINYNETAGGAGIAANRIHNGLNEMGVESYSYVARKQTKNIETLTPPLFSNGFLLKFYGKADQLILRKYPLREKVIFSTSKWGLDPSKLIQSVNPDIVHLHWINNGFMRVFDIGQIKQPIVWTLHDMWPFTGGCHYDSGCGKHSTHCERCPILKSKTTYDLAYNTFEEKRKYWGSLDLNIITPSNWLADVVNQSELMKRYPVTVIPNCIDTKKHVPINKNEAREVLDLPANKKLIMFGAMSATEDKRKGLSFLESALNILVKNDDSLRLVIFGNNDENISKSLRAKTIFLGHLKGLHNLAYAYSAADVFVAPSVQENLGTTIMESLLFGTPVAAFNVGGNSDLIDHKKNGYLAPTVCAAELAQGIRWIISDNGSELGRNARVSVEKKYNTEKVVNQHISFYNEIIQSGG
jgi:glycosyltransferase involved in cell wall biosynthesis